MVILLVVTVLILVVLLAVLVSLLYAGHGEKVKDINKRVILRGGKNVNPDAAACGDGIIGEDMDQDDTIVRGKGRRRGKNTEMLCLTEMESRRAYQGAFSQGQLMIGRGDSSLRRQKEGQLWLDDRKVSQMHCLVFRENGVYWVEDCDSTNHTWVNGGRVTGAVNLWEGDLLRLANKEYQVRFIMGSNIKDRI